MCYDVLQLDSLNLNQVAFFLITNGFQGVDKAKGNCLFWTYPLHVAVKQNNAYIASKLLMFGASPMAKDFWGRRPCDYARGSTHQKIIEVFAKAEKSNQSDANLYKSVYTSTSCFHSNS